jgi:hypothetical protein
MFISLVRPARHPRKLHSNQQQVPHPPGNRRVRNDNFRWVAELSVEEGVGVAFLADGGYWAVAGINDGGVGQLHELAA